MLITYNKKTTNPADVRSVDLFKSLSAIKDGKFKSEVSKVRVETNKERRGVLKNLLSGFVFSGTFSYRSKTKLKQSSGLAMLDFDEVQDLDELRSQVDADNYTFSSFVSPSGNGLKALVRIPLVPDDKTYKEYYLKIQEHYDRYAKTDDSTKDISRFTYVSYDPDLYLNTDSEVFTDKFIAKERPITEVTNIPLTDQDEIAERLEKWFVKKYSTTQNRNNNLHSFARQFNAFGVNQSICETYLLRYEQADFKENEILKLIESAYRYSEEYNTQSFEDEKKVKVIKNAVLAGGNINKIKDVDPDKLALEVEKHKADLVEDEFWYYTENDAIKLSSSRFKTYLESNNISKYYPSADSGFLFIKKDSNFIKEFDENRIKDFTLNDLLNRSEIDAFELCADNLRTFNGNYLSFLNTSKIDIQRDTRDKGFIYYKNTAVKITQDETELIPYSSLNGLVWENQVIDRNFQPAPESEGEFKTFLWKISGEDKQRYFSFKSAIGYLLHGYQNEGKPKVIIFNDEMISDVPNGGSGKGLIHKAINHIKKLSTINGKGFDPSGQFAYQTVGTDTQVLLFDDIDKNFKFENLFSIITEGLIIEKKGKDAIKIPFNESPKISITTNYTVKGEGSSHLRRVFELEMAAYFNDERTPEDEFGHLLFSDWSEDEWQRFDNFMIRCVQYYLKNGLVKYKMVNLELRKLINDTNNEFIDFMNNQDWTTSKRWYKNELKDAFVDEYEEFRFAKWFTTNTFNKWITKYCDYNKDLVFEKKQSNGQRYITIQKVPF
tara:strand:- start:192 stop:2519 length:2328 start_codon:yes stop_codon:yes gene_type:complete